MNAMNRFCILSFFWVVAYFLVACSGSFPQTKTLTTRTGPDINTVVVQIESARNDGMVSARPVELSSAPKHFRTASPDRSSAMIGTEILDSKDTVFVGDQIRLQLTIHSDGTFSAHKVEPAQNIFHHSQHHGHHEHGDSNYGGSCGGGCSGD